MMQPHGDIVLNIGRVSLTLFKKSIVPSTVFCPIPNGWKLCRLQNYLGRMPNWAIENASAEALVPISNTRKENSKILFKKECSMTFKSTLFKNTKFVNIQCREELRNGPCDILFSLFLLEIIQTSVQFAMTSAILLLYFKIRDLKKSTRKIFFKWKELLCDDKINDSFKLFQPPPESAFLTNSSGKVMKLIFLAY